MPYSHNFYKQDVKSFIDKTVSKKSKILDVGPGNGTYSALLKSLGYELDCLEIFEPYVVKYNLSEKYNKVILGNIVYFDIEDYDFIILGDILEHLSVDEAKLVINRIVKQGKSCIVAVPYLCEQGTMEDNEYETHHQPDLTHEVMVQRYPELQLLVKYQYYGYYHIKTKDDLSYWDFDKQYWVKKVTPKIVIDSIDNDTVKFTNQSNDSILINVEIFGDGSLCYSNYNMMLLPKTKYFVSQPGVYKNKRIYLKNDTIHKEYQMI